MTRFEECFRNIAARARIRGHDDPKADILRLVSNWLSNEAGDDWLLILDNADDEEVFYGTSENFVHIGSSGQDLSHDQSPLVSFLPQTPNGHILVTSRNKSLASKLILGDDAVYEVRLMDKDTAIQFSRRRYR